MPQSVSRDEMLAEAAQRLRDVDPAACLVLPRVVRRVIKEHLELAGLPLHVPHRKCHVINRGTCLYYVNSDELSPSEPQTDRVILIAHPDEQELEGMSPPQLLRELWRTLFHARIHIELDSEVAVGRLTAEAVHARIDRLGQAQFDEAAAVLKHEHFLLHPANYVQTWIEFAAVWTELTYFAPEWRSCYFPSIETPDEVDALLAEDFDAGALYQATRLVGAAEPGEPSAEILETSVLRLLWRAEEASALGNAVNAALLRADAGKLAPPAYASESVLQADAELGRLALRLQRALEIPDADLAEWKISLGLLLANSRHGFWDPDKRLLYDLQNICVDSERESHKLDPWSWLFTLGRSPLKRPLPHLREVLVVRHLHKSQVRLPSSQLEGADRERLTRLLRNAAHEAETRLRDRFRPVIADSLLDVGLHPVNLPERVALQKVVDELLDVIVSRGFLTLGILRDALSRNNLKFPDFPPPPKPAPLIPAATPHATGSSGNGSFRTVGAEVGGTAPEQIGASTNGHAPAASKPSWIRRTVRAIGCSILALFGSSLSGDPLLKADRRLALKLDGVYRRGDIYLRILQGASAIAFGTPLGRFATKYLVLPFGGAFLVLSFLEHVGELIQKYVYHHEVPHHEFHWPNPYAWAGLGAFIFFMLHVPPFRRLILRHVLLSAFNVVRGVLFDIPLWFLRIPVVHRFLYSRPVIMCRRLLLSPALVTAITWAIIWISLGRELDRWWVLAIFVGIAMALNSRLGRDAEEVSTEYVGRTWYLIRARILVALFELIMDFFKQVLEYLERWLYAVDEWLRFRAGESRVSLAVKSVLGMIWSGVNYVLRFCINLLVEPQVNPIKHFPVVTVSHKIIFPMQGMMWPYLVPAFGDATGKAIALGLVTVIPGVFGFLVWELKENWRLYAANRRKQLSPVMIGHHGETFIRLMKPGLHSGTLPKLYSRIRRAQRKSYLSRKRTALAWYHEQLHHLEQALHHFFDREFVSLLTESQSWGPQVVTVGHIHLASNSVRVELCCAELSADSVWLTFEEQSGWLLASVSQPGWVDVLPYAPRAAFEMALLGLYKLAGVDFVREDVRAKLGPRYIPWDIREQQLLVWPSPDFKVMVHYNLEDRPSRPRPRAAARQFALPELDPLRLMFCHQPIRWEQWVSAWNHESPETGPHALRTETPVLLPPPGRIPPQAVAVATGDRRAHETP